MRVKRAYVWEAPMRTAHWVNAAAISFLGFTGLYIGNPFLQAPPGEVFYMATMRFIHFVAAYFLTVFWLVRLYWSFTGNEYSRLRVFFPFARKEGRRAMAENLKFYLFVSKHPPVAVGHTPLGAISYLIVFLLLFVEIITGFALYSHSHHGFFWVFIGGWLLSVISSPMVRFVHHSITWVMILFVIIHIYLAWLNDIVEKNYVVSSIFSGYKGVHED